MSLENINIETRRNIVKFDSLANRSTETAVYAFGYLYNIIHDPNCNEELKRKCFEKAVNRVILSNTYECAIEFLHRLSYEFFSNIGDQSDRSLSIISMLRQIMNHPAVVESYKTSRVYHKSHRFVVKSAYAVDQLFRDETALQILRNTSNRKLFIVFGYHPVIVNHVDLQVKWIKYYSKYKKITPIFGIRNLTDEALLSAPIDDAFKFICKVVEQSYRDFARNMKHFTVETIKKIVYMHILAYGKHEDAEEVLRAIDYTRLYRKLSLNAPYFTDE